MATFNFSRMSVGVNSDDIVAEFLSYGPLKNLALTVHDETEFQLQPSGPTMQYLGTGFKYKPNGDPKAGVITDINTYFPGHANLTFNVTELNIDIAEMKSVFATKTNPLDDLAFVAKIFSGNDTFIGGKVDDKFYGLGGKDTMFGKLGNDSLDGGGANDSLTGGPGFDLLTGGAGKDAFIFDKSVNNGTGTSTNVDTITDFNLAGDDVIKLKASAFKQLGAAGTTLDDAKFIEESTATVHKTGAVVYDANGDLWWTKGAIIYQFAHLDGHPPISAADFLIV